VTALDSLAADLACPVCRAALGRDDGAGSPGRLVCATGHGFDVARQGHVSLFDGRARASTGDTADMVARRDRFLSAGHYAPIASAVAALTPPTGLVADLAGGTGWYSAAVLDQHPDARGVSLDLSAFAARRAARAHPRLAAVVADAWRELPLADGSASTVLSIFGPRSAAEIARVLRPGGRLIVVTPTSRHLDGVREPLGMLTMDARKDERLAESLGIFELESEERVETELSLDAAALEDLVLMGPSAHHADRERLAASIAQLVGDDERARTLLSVRVSRWTPRVEAIEVGEAIEPEHAAGSTTEDDAAIR